MKTNLRWLSIGILGMALAVTSALAQDPQYEPNPSHQNSAVLQSHNLDKSNSAMQHSAPARQNTAEEAIQKLRQKTSPEHEYGWNAATTIWMVVLVVCLIGLISVLRRPAPRRLEPQETRRAA